MTRARIIYRAAQGTISFEHEPTIIVPLHVDISKMTFPRNKEPKIHALQDVQQDLTVHTSVKKILNEFSDVITEVPRRTHLGEYSVRLRPNCVPPVVNSPYHVNPALLPIMKQQIQKLLDQDMIKPYHGRATCSAFLVPKPRQNAKDDISYRLV